MDAMEQHPPSLAEQVEAFLTLHNMSPVTFGRKALRDPHFVRDLRAGRDLKMSTVDRVRTFMAEYEAEVDTARAA